MSFWVLLLIALGVSADAFAVALGKGLHMRRLDYRHAVIIAVVFGLFQAVMPVIGWFLGSQFERYIVDYDHWVAFGLLVVIGGKMIWEALTGKDEEKDGDTLPVKELLVLGLATSVDALAIGLTFALLDVSILGAAGLIGVTTLVLAFVGVLIGHRIGARFRGPAEIVGGIILILIGTRILLEHLGVW